MQENRLEWKNKRFEETLNVEEKQEFNSPVFNRMLSKIMADCDEEVLRLSKEIRKNPMDNEVSTAIAVRAELKKKLELFYNMRLT